jgi:hypothetical protein
MNKYYLLTNFLKEQQKNIIELTFQEVILIINNPLPESAYKYRPWWANDKTHSQAQAWLDAGYIIDSVDQYFNKVIFRKTSIPKTHLTPIQSYKTASILNSHQQIDEVGLVSCTKRKQHYPAKPKDLYMASALFRKARQYCELHYQSWYILSAKHHLLKPDGPLIEPYNETLNTATSEEKIVWSQKVFEQLKEQNLLKKTLVIHAGKNYYHYLIPFLEQNHVHFRIPTKGLSIGNTLSWYNKQLGEDSC